MAVNVSVQNNGGFLPDIILLTLLCYCHWRTRLIVIKSVCFYSLNSPVKVLTFFPRWVDAIDQKVYIGLDALVRIFL